MDVEASATGTVRHLAAAGQTFAPGTVIGYLYAPGEEIPAVLPTPMPRRIDEASPAEPVASVPEPAAPAAQPGGRVPSSPIARRLAAELGVALATVHGSGPEGRVEEADVRAAHAASLELAAGSPAEERIAVHGMRAVIAERMYESLRTTPSSRWAWKLPWTLASSGAPI